jgi:hypothetical protein
MKARKTQHLLVDAPLVYRDEAVATQESPPVFPLQQVLNERRREPVNKDIKTNMIAKCNKELKDVIDKQEKTKQIKKAKFSYEELCKQPPKLKRNKTLSNAERWQAVFDWVQGCGTYDCDDSKLEIAKKLKSWIEPMPTRPTVDEDGDVICIGWRVQQRLLRRIPFYQKNNNLCTFANLSKLTVPTKKDENGKWIQCPIIKGYLSTDFLVCMFKDLGDTISTTSAIVPTSLPSSKPHVPASLPSSKPTELPSKLKASKYGKHTVIESRVNDAVKWESCIGNIEAVLQATSDDSDEAKAEKEAKLNMTMQTLTRVRTLLRPIECNKDAVEDLFLLAGWSEASIAELFDRRVSDVSDASIVSDEGDSTVTIEEPVVAVAATFPSLDAESTTSDADNSTHLGDDMPTSDERELDDNTAAPTQPTSQTDPQPSTIHASNATNQEPEPSAVEFVTNELLGSMYISDTSRYPTFTTVRRSCRIAKGKLYREGMYKC